MRRRELLGTAGLGAFAAAAVPGLLQLTAGAAGAQAVETEFQFTGLSSAGLVGGVGHVVAATGSGAISGRQVDGGGAFTHYDELGLGAPKPILGSGTWRATRLLGYREVGAFGALVAGVADVEVELTREVPTPATMRGRLRIVADLPPAGVANGEPSGYTLSIVGGPGPFRPRPDAGMAVFSRVALAPAAAPAGAASAPISEALLMPQADTPERALLLEPGKTLRGHLAGGDPAGQFAYYRFAYPGHGWTFTIDLQVFPDQSNLLQNAGFNVYGGDPARLYLRGGQQHLHRPNVSADFRGADAGIYSVQVYNYDPVLPIDFEITGTQGTTP